MPRGGGGGGGGGGFGSGGGGRGRKKNHKGGRRVFTDEDQLREQAVKDEKAKAWRRQCGIESSDEDEEAAAKNRDMPPSDSSDESSEDEARVDGVSHLIEVENPNRTGSKAAKKVTELAASGTTTLSRREREELEKQEAKRKYQALHAQGKTDEAQADLARLAIIRKQREDAAKKRDEDQKAREVKEAAAKKNKS